MIELIGRLVRASQRIRRAERRGARAGELAEALGLPLDRVQAALKVARGMADLEAGGLEADSAPAPGDPEAGLDARTERVLCLRFGITQDADPLLDRLGRQILETRQRVRDLEAKIHAEAKDDGTD